MLTTRTVALASLLVIAHLMNNGKEGERDREGGGHSVNGIVVLDCECLQHLYVLKCNFGLDYEKVVISVEK
jgi:hypothetical protein